MLKQILKSGLIITFALGMVVAASTAYFMSTVNASSADVNAGTMRLAIDSTHTHTLTQPTDWYTVAEDVNGSSVSYAPLSSWQNAVLGAYIPYTNTPGEDTYPSGNQSYWVALRNTGSVPMKLKLNLGGGNWVANPAIETANPLCTSALLDRNSPITARNVHIYQQDNCEGHEECQNILLGLKNLDATHPWSYVSSLKAPVDIGGSTLSDPVFLTADGTSTGTPIQVDSHEFLIARIDLNFDTADNCYQGATYNFNVTGEANQLNDKGNL